MRLFIARNRVPVLVTCICALLFLIYIVGAPDTFLSCRRT